MADQFSLSSILSDALAPVFLIAGVSSLIGTMSGRYGRVIDRIRTLLRDGDKLYPGQQIHLGVELSALYRRAKLLRYTLVLSVVSVFSVSATVFCLFFELSFGYTTSFLAEGFFVVAMLFLMISLGLFMQDFLISLGSIKHDIKTRSDIQVSEDNG